MKHLYSLLCIAAMLHPACAEQRIELEGTTVIGNRELPKITHIVPWQAAQLPDPEPPPLDHLIDDALTPLDRDEFRRRILYYHEAFPAVQIPSEASQTTAK